MKLLRNFQNSVNKFCCICSNDKMEKKIVFQFQIYLCNNGHFQFIRKIKKLILDFTKQKLAVIRKLKIGKMNVIQMHVYTNNYWLSIDKRYRILMRYYDLKKLRKEKKKQY